MFTEFPPWNFVTFIRNCSAIKIVLPGSFVYKLFTMILGQNYKSNKILLAEAFANCDKLQDADVAAKEKQLIQIKQLIKQMSASVKDVYGSFSAQLSQPLLVSNGNYIRVPPYEGKIEFN